MSEDVPAYLLEVQAAEIRRRWMRGENPYPSVKSPYSGKIVENAAEPSVLLEAQGLVHGNRGADYGHPLDDYTRTAGMVSAMLAHILKRPIQADEMIQIMICVKLSRQVNKPKRDNTVDGAGYFECLQMAIDEFDRRNQGDLKSE